jgi:hypothetical protein
MTTRIPRPEYRESKHFPKHLKIVLGEVIKEENCYVGLENPEQCPRCGYGPTRPPQGSDHENGVDRGLTRSGLLLRAKLLVCDNCNHGYVIAQAD